MVPSVGDRVVVRRRLPAGSSHPLTDVLGELVSDGDPLVVRTRDGTLVAIDRADVVRCKQIPARAVAASAVREVEHAAALGWPGLEHAWSGGWLLRSGAGVTRRACSAVPLAGPSGDDAPATADPVSVAAVVDFYSSRGEPPVVVVPDRLGRPPPGWVRSGPEVLVLTGSLDVVAGAATTAGRSGAPDGATVSAEPDDGWLARWSRSAADPVTARRVLTASVDSELGFVQVVRDGGVVAVARVAVTTVPSGARWAGVTAVEVDPARRRTGLAHQVSAAALGWAAQRGAAKVQLQVAADNAAGLGLWRRLGLIEHHRYTYATPPG